MSQLRHIPYKWLVAIVFVSGLFMDILDTTVVNVALPTLGREFHTGTETLEWVVTGYLLSLAIWIPASGWIGDRFGTKRTFLFALVMFTAGSALCGLAWNVGSLIAFRILQGVGGGMLTPVGTAMLYRAFPPQERAKASAVLAVPTMIAPAAGPILGGWLVDAASWRWIFYVNLPVGLLAIVFAFFALREHREPRAGAFDLPGFVLSGGGLALMLFALSRGAADGWTSPHVLGTGLVGLVMFAALVRVELTRPDPMLDLRLFADRMFRNSNLVMFTAMGAMLGVLFLLPLFLQTVRGLSALQSGLATFPQALGMGAMVPLTSRLYPKVGPRRMMMAGLAGVAITSLLFMRVGLTTDIWWVRGLMFLRGMSMAFSMIPLQAATFASIRPQDTGRASSLFSTSRQIAASVGVAVLSTVLVDRMAGHVAAVVSAGGPVAARTGMVSAYHDAFAVSALFGVVGVLFALLVKDKDAEATMKHGAVAGVDNRQAAAAH